MAELGNGLVKDMDDGYGSDADAQSCYSDDDGDNEIPNHVERDRTQDFIRFSEDADPQVPADEQIRYYEQLEKALYPNSRLEAICARNTALGRPVRPPVSHNDRPRTAREKQWMEEKKTLSSYTREDPSDGKSLHQQYKDRQSLAAPTTNPDRRRETGGTRFVAFSVSSSTDSGESDLSHPNSPRKSLAKVADTRDSYRASHRLSQTKANLVRVLNTDQEAKPRRSTVYK